MGQEPGNDPGQEPTPAAPGQEPAGTPKTEPSSPKTFDEAYVTKLRQEAAEARKASKDLETKVKTYEDRDKSDQQKLEERAAKAEGRATSAETQLLRFEVAAEKNIPLKHAHRLQGSTKEELAKDAEELAKELGTNGTPSYDGGVRGEPAPTGGMDDLIRRQARR